MTYGGTILEVHTGDPDLLYVKTDISTTGGNQMSELVPQSLMILWEKSRDAFLSTVEIQTYEYELHVRKGISQFEARLTGCGER